MSETLTKEEVAISREFAEVHRERFHMAVCDSHELLRARLDAAMKSVAASPARRSRTASRPTSKTRSR